MNTEMLIELVRDRSCLYDMSDKKYSDHPFKEALWREIASTLNQPVQNCKKVWTSLRDGYRRAAKKSTTVSGQSSKFIKKWKYAEEMEFLRPHIKERDTISNIGIVSDEDNDTILQSDSENEEVQVASPSEVFVAHSVQDVGGTPIDGNSTAPTQPLKKKMKKSNLPKPTETASTTLMKYILEQKNAETTQTKVNELDALDQFFLSVCSTVKQFSPYLQHLAKSKVFTVISELELEHLKQNQPQTQVVNHDILPQPTQNVSLLQPSNLLNFHNTLSQNFKQNESPSNNDSVSPNQYMYDLQSGTCFYTKTRDTM